MLRFASILIVLVLAFVGCRQDSSQWKFAQGLNEYENGNLDQAIELLQDGLKLDPNATSIKLRLAKMLAENCQGDLGLTWCDEVLDQYPKNKMARVVRVECLQYLGRFEEAFREYQKAVAEKVDKPAEQLNNLAYFRALADRELDKAARQIDLAIEKHERNVGWANMRGVPIHVQAVVSIGILARHVEGYEYVMEPLNDLIIQHEDLWLAYDAEINRLVKNQESARETEGVVAEQFQPEIDNVGNRMQNIEGSLALLLATRCLIAEDLEDETLADRDRLWLKKIGYQPQEVFDRLPSKDECWNTVDISMMFLDTRGFVSTKLPWELIWSDPLGREIDLPRDSFQLAIKKSSYVDVLFDLDIAIAAAEVNRLAVNSQLSNRLELSLAAVRFQQQQAGKLIAVLRYHRLKAHEKAGQFDQAAADQQRIEELGFEADCSLF
jgi:tetratricopeptide (TPR) repeat protein